MKHCLLGTKQPAACCTRQPRLRVEACPAHCTVMPHLGSARTCCARIYIKGWPAALSYKADLHVPPCRRRSRSHAGQRAGAGGHHRVCRQDLQVRDEDAACLLLHQEGGRQGWLASGWICRQGTSVRQLAVAAVRLPRSRGSVDSSSLLRSRQAGRIAAAQQG